jgi:hypothetical protein
MMRGGGGSDTQLVVDGQTGAESGNRHLLECSLLERGVLKSQLRRGRSEETGGIAAMLGDRVERHPPG